MFLAKAELEIPWGEDSFLSSTSSKVYLMYERTKDLSNEINSS